MSNARMTDADHVRCANVADHTTALIRNEDRWVYACGGTELPFLYEGTRWVYVWNPAQQEHGYLNLDTDVVQPNYRRDA